MISLKRCTSTIVLYSKFWTRLAIIEMVLPSQRGFLEEEAISGSLQHSWKMSALCYRRYQQTCFHCLIWKKEKTKYTEGKE